MLNGWQRLWVVISALIFLVSLLVVAEEFPKKSDIYNSWANETIDQVLSAGVSNNLSRADIRRSYDDFSDIDLKNRIQEQYSNYSELLELKFQVVNRKHEDELQGLLKEQIVFIGSWLIGLAIVMAGIYIFGWTIGWIRKGFQNS